MSDHLGRTTVDWHRQDLLISAARAKRPMTTSHDACVVAGLPLSLAARQQLHASSVGRAARACPVTDILGYWSGESVARRSFPWPGRREVLDWGIWCCLVFLAVAYEITGAR